MKKLCALVFFLLPLVSFAQPQFTSSDFPKIGDTALTILLPFQTIDESRVTATGTSFTWDFSGESNWDFLSQSPTVQRSYRYDSPKPPQSTNFPEATLSEYSLSSDGVTTYELRNDTLYQLIAGGSSNSLGTPYFPPIPIIFFPMSMDQSSEFTTGLKPTKTYPNPVAIREHKVTYDGYGSVKLPWVTYSDLFRIRMESRDSNYLTGFTTYTYQYLWYKKGGAVPVLRISRLGSYAANSFDIWATLRTGTSSVGDVSTSSTGLSSTVINDERLILHFNEVTPQQFEIVSSLGIRQMKSYIRSGEPIDIHHLTSGVYSLIIPALHRETMKFIIVR
jgi:hypothetical protein